jgi:hypothetical protein
MPLLKLTADILAAALEGFEAQKNRIDAKIAEIRQMLGGSRVPALTDTGKPRKKRSAGVRRKMALAQRARYAKLKQASAPQPANPAIKRTMSASARKRIAAAQRKRWAAIRRASRRDTAVTR